MTIIEQVMFELERLLPRVSDHRVRQELRQLIYKLSVADMTMSDLYAEINELRRRYAQFDDILPPPLDEIDPENNQDDQ